MVTKILLLLTSFLLLSTFAMAECVPYWECSGWSICNEQTGLNTRTCLDMNDCKTSTSPPVQLKKCDDEETYEPKNTLEDDTAMGSSEMPENTTGMEDEPDEEKDEDEKSKEANIFIGYGIILLFVVIGIIIGRIFRRKKMINN